LTVGLFATLTLGGLLTFTLALPLGNAPFYTGGFGLGFFCPRLAGPKQKARACGTRQTKLPKAPNPS